MTTLHLQKFHTEEKQHILFIFGKKLFFLLIYSTSIHTLQTSRKPKILQNMSIAQEFAKTFSNNIYRQ